MTQTNGPEEAVSAAGDHHGREGTRARSSDEVPGCRLRSPATMVGNHPFRVISSMRIEGLSQFHINVRIRTAFSSLVEGAPQPRSLNPSPGASMP